MDAVARGLIDLGIGPGDKVSLWMMNRPEWIYAALAVMRIGAVLRATRDGAREALVFEGRR